jgi:hypothetical protein
MASTNWEYFTEEMLKGPRKDECLYSTTNAKSQFRLDTSDLATITGYRRPTGHWGGGNSLTMYFQSDLEALSDKKYLYINVPFVPVQEPVKKVEPPEQKAIEKEQRSKQKPFEIFPTLIRARKGNLLLTQNQAARQAKKQRSWDFLLAVPVLEGVLMYRQSLPH